MAVYILLVRKYRNTQPNTHKYTRAYTRMYASLLAGLVDPSLLLLAYKITYRFTSALFINPIDSLWVSLSLSISLSALSFVSVILHVLSLSLSKCLPSLFLSLSLFFYCNCYLVHLLSTCISFNLYSQSFVRLRANVCWFYTKIVFGRKHPFTA